ncbi:MAG: DUF2857 domain-containing protein [Proteobacteria bacterium]|nr:DUF2857 domain-containing protein [Pseudomonadota bacterium]MCL2590574.1 DUF2857 domain-containing protein [Betaproteobacteria bacterium]
MMTSQQTLNSAVVGQALQDLHNGHYSKVRARGFCDELIEALKRPEVAAALAKSNIQWVTTSVDNEKAIRIANQTNKLVEDAALIDRMLRAGASTDQISSWYGISHQDVGSLRNILKLPTRKGRPEGLTKDEEEKLWEHWSNATNPRKNDKPLDLTDSEKLRMFALETAERLDIPMAAVWGAFQDWMARGV